MQYVYEETNSLDERCYKHFDLTPLFNQPPNAKDEKQRERHGKKYLIVVSCDRGISASL